MKTPTEKESKVDKQIFSYRQTYDLVDAVVKERLATRDTEVIEILTGILNEMPVFASVGYRTEIGDKFREALKARSKK